MAAVSRGESVDTTMGLTPTGGLGDEHALGDLDPGSCRTYSVKKMPASSGGRIT